MAASHSPNISKHPDLFVVYRSPESLKPNTRNNRTHSRPQIRKLKEGILAFGFVNPVLINTDGMIITGHGRVLAAKLPNWAASLFGGSNNEIDLLLQSGKNPHRNNIKLGKQAETEPTFGNILRPILCLVMATREIYWRCIQP